MEQLAKFHAMELRDIYGYKVVGRNSSFGNSIMNNVPNEKKARLIGNALSLILYEFNSPEALGGVEFV